jgi:hypothetical protein
MKLSFYFRSPVLSFFELSETQQDSITNELTYLSREELECESFVIDPQRGEIFPLSMFMRIEKKGIFCGIYTMSQSSACFLALSRCGAEAVVSYKYGI